MKVSVIIPVYNAAKHILYATASAVKQAETLEVLLVEDGSTDESLKVCEDLARKFSKVRLLRHADKKNHGLSATRNLGIKNAQCELIAFLDADDYFVDGRFSVALPIMLSHENVDGVYEAIESFFEPGVCERDYWAINRSLLTTMDHPYVGQSLLPKIITGRHGFASVAGTLFRRSALEHVGLFDESLEIHEDTALMTKLAASRLLVPGRLDVPVLMRRVHGGNMSLTQEWNMTKMWAVVLRWAIDRPGVFREHKLLLLKRYMMARAHIPARLTWKRRLQLVRVLLLIAKAYPSALSLRAFWSQLQALIPDFLPQWKLPATEKPTEV